MSSIQKLLHIENYNAGFVEEIKRNMMNSSTAKSSIDPRMVLKNIFLAVEMIVKNPTLINPSKPSKSTKSSSHSRKLDYLMSILFLALGSVKKTNWVTLDAEKYALNILTKLLDLNLYKLSYSLLLFVHSSLTNTKSSNFTTTSPRADTFQQLLLVNSHSASSTKNHRNISCIYFLNVFRVAHGLGFNSNFHLNELAYHPDGLLTCYRALYNSNESQGLNLCDNAFRYFYKAGMESEAHKNCLEHFKLGLTLFTMSHRFDPSMMDKIIAQVSQKYLKTHNDSKQLAAFLGHLLETQSLTDSLRISTIHWMEIALLVNQTSESSTIYNVIINMIKRGSLAKSVEESMIRTIEAIQWLSDPTGNADTPVLIESLECTSFDELEIQWLLFLFGKLYKMIQNNTDKSFQECLVGCSKTVLNNGINNFLYNTLNSMNKTVMGLISFDEKKTMTLGMNICSCLTQLSFIVGSYEFSLNSERWNSFLSMNDQTKAIAFQERISSLCFNIGVSLCNSKNYPESLHYLSESCNLYVKLINTKTEVFVRRKVTTIQCMLSLTQYKNVVESIVNLIRDVPHLIQQEEFEKSLVSCICMYMAASHGQTNGQYQPLCRSFINNLNAIHLLKLADLEYNQMTFSNYSIPTSVLEEVIGVALEVSTSQFAQLKWKIRLVECKRMYEPEAATALITKYIESHDKKDTPEPNILFMISKLHVELAISMNECDKFDGTLFEYVFEMWAKWTSEKLVDEANKASMYSYMVHLCDYLDGIGSHRLLACCLQLTIKFAHVNEIEPQRMQHMFIRLSNTFLIMGYSGRAGLALEMAKSYSGNDNGSFYISYANYLCDIESTEKCLDIRSKIVAEDMHSMKKSDSIHFSMLKRLDSRICIRRCLFPKALDEALSSYRLLSTLLSKSETNSSALKKLTTPIQTSLLLDTLQRICDVYKLQGEPKPLEYYLKVGVDLARKSHSLHFQMLFLTLLADLEVRRDNLTQSKDYLQQVDSLRVSEGNEHVMALYHLKQGDVFSTDDSLVLDAGKEYQRAESIIDELCNPGYTKDFEFQELNPKSTKSKSAKEMAKKSTVSAKMSSRCFGLEYLKSDALFGKESLYERQREFKKAEVVLQHIGTLSLASTHRARYLHSISQMKLDNFLRRNSSVSRLEMFNESVLCLPWNLVSASKSASKTKNLEKQIDSILKTLNEAFVYNFCFGSAKVAQSIINSLITLQFIQGYIFNDIRLSLSVPELIHKLDIPISLYSSRHNFSNTTADDPKAFFEDSYSSFTQEIIEKLPSNITVVILSIDTKKNVLNIGRLEGHAANTIFRLPLTRSQTRDGGLNGNGLDYTSVSSEFDQIMKLNVETTSNAKVCITNQEKRKWVESRKSLDNRLHKLLKSIEKEWLAGFKGIFSTVSFPIGIINEFKLKLEKLIFENISQFSSKTRKLEFNSDLCKLILSLGPKTESGDLEDIIFYLLDFYQCQGVPVEYSEIDIEEILFAMNDLITKFYKKHKLEQSFATDNHLVLILDKFSQKFPWESLPCMRSTSVSRLPNSSILKMQLSSERIVDPSKTFYLLNPSEDLIRTQNQFEPHLDINWNGIVGRKPVKDEILAGVGDSEIFLYAGHGGGEEYLNNQTFSSLNKVPVALLFGCSSGQLKANGEFDPYGIVLTYLNKGCPAVVGNLWDVTDIDFDRFSIKFLQNWGLFTPSKSKYYSICESLAMSRDECKLKYLVGAAPVVYGLPVHLQK